MDLFIHMCEQVHTITTGFITMLLGAWCLKAGQLCSGKLAVLDISLGN